MLKRQLELLKPHLAKVAQDVFETWDEWPCGCCDEIAREMAGVINEHLPHVDIMDGGQEGDDHAWLIVCDSMTTCGVDIPYSHYEIGGGYSWIPKQDVSLTEEHVEIWRLK